VIGVERVGLTTSSASPDEVEVDLLDLLVVEEVVVIGAERSGLMTSSPVADPSVDCDSDLLALLDEEVAVPETSSEFDSVFLPFDDAERDDVVLIVFLPVNGDNTPNSYFSLLRLFVVVYFFMTLPLIGASSTSYSLTGLTTS
jgi:hypothetical protein